MPPLEPRENPRALWRSLDDRANDPSFRALVAREFPAHADEMLAPSRRDFLRLMGASVALAGMTACRRWPEETIVPFAHLPEGYVPGATLRFASSLDLSGAAAGVLVTSYDGRPIKIEGNPLHPQSLGATDPYAQAAVLEMYDPDRSAAIVERDPQGHSATRNRQAFSDWAQSRFAALRGNGGLGLRVVSGPSSSHALFDLKARFAATFPHAAWVEWDPLSRDAAREGAAMAFGRPARVHLDLTKADVIAAFDADILSDHETQLANARAWGAGRRASGGTMNRMYAVEAAYTLTGGCADHRLAVASAVVPVVLGKLAAALLAQGMTLPGGAESIRESIELFAAHWYQDARIALAAKDLWAARGRGAIVVGKQQPPAAHALAHVLNAALGNLGGAVWLSEDPDGARPSHRDAISQLAVEMGTGRVTTVVILGGNPAYDAPADLDFAGRLKGVADSVRLGLYDDETSAACRWHVPQAHALEAWSDTRGWDGTAGISQPLIAPLYDGMSSLEFVSLMLDGHAGNGYEIVRDAYRGLLPGAAFESSWRRAVHDGVVPETRFSAIAPAIANGWGAAVAKLAVTGSQNASAMELVFTRSASSHDGRFANLGWLVELPDPITKLTWENAALIGPADAKSLGVKATGDLVTIDANGRSVTIPAFILPGQAQGTVAVALGWGRTHAGRIGSGIGVDAYALRASGSLWRCPASVRRVAGREEIATTQDHHIVDALGKREQAVRAEELIRTGTLAEFKKHPEFARERVHLAEDAPLWTPHEYNGHKWGMAIDLTACTGCHACTIACQAENNIPVVGKDEVRRGREMHWIRVDRYFEGEPESPRLAFQPMACHHCENAPCEQVCPVAATVHDHEGLNVMVYNRCVGTRYCSNNCPYKVRRFNWFNNHKHDTAVSVMVYNPEVTVRSRGVMEKCTYCIQRIEAVKIEAKNAQRAIADGEIVPACAQVCPTEAIVFGDLNDAKSKVRALHDDPRCYGVLEEVNTKPRTRYLARLTNPAEGRPNAMVTAAIPRPSRDNTSADPEVRAPLVLSGNDYASVTDKVCGIVEAKTPPEAWKIAFGIAATFTGILGAMVLYLITTGVGVWGLNKPVSWGFDITNFVFWVGIGHAGTLISAILYLFRQKWRTGINRFAEAMTIFAVICALLFPGIHVGRIWMEYWIAPLPNQMSIWPNFRSPLLWDFFAVGTYFTVSLCFWYMGLIPDIATVRDRAKGRVRQIAYGIAALGWNGSNRHWHRYERAYLLLAGLATPLVLSVHSIVSFDFATSMLPGWHATIFPPYFVAGAIFGGFAMVLLLAVPCRAWFGLKDVITPRHLENMCKILLATGMMVGYAYAIEFFISWYSGNPAEGFVFINRAFGPYAWAYWTMVFCNVVTPQVFWSRRARSNPWLIFGVAFCVNVGMWFERFVIIVTSLSRDFLPSSWNSYTPTWVEVLTLMGSFGLFFTLFLLFLRFLPMVAMAEVKAIMPAPGDKAHR